MATSLLRLNLRRSKEKEPKRKIRRFRGMPTGFPTELPTPTRGMDSSDGFTTPFGHGKPLDNPMDNPYPVRQGCRPAGKIFRIDHRHTTPLDLRYIFLFFIQIQPIQAADVRDRRTQHPERKYPREAQEGVYKQLAGSLLYILDYLI